MKQVPHSLSYHETSLTKVGVRPMHAPASKIDERESEMKSFDTTWSSVYPMIPLYSGDSAFALISALISSIVAPFSSLHVRSTTETSGVGTRNAMPVSLPLRSGITLPTAGAAPAAPVLARRAVDRLLRRRRRVDRRHQPLDDGVLLVDDLGEGGEAVGRARRVRQHVDVLGVL